MYFGILLALLAAAGGLLYRNRLGRIVRGRQPLLTDDMLRQIEMSGHIDVDEPLDLEQIREEEARFLDEYPWEEPDE
ncbi:MAG TPA: hypothetical protein VMN60_02170 [Longimicrobiales bacterium]|nr:hypothetical protein [Longimicrobiales bacterium]